MRQQPRPLQRAPSAPAVDPSTLDTLPMFHDFLEGNTPTKPDEDAETRDKSHGLADLPPAEINSDLPGDAMEPKTRDQLGSDLPDQPCRTLDQPVASDDKSVHDEAEPPAPQNVVTEKAEGEHGGAVPLEDTKEGGEKDDPHEGKPDAADGSEDLFNVEVQTTRQEQFEERDRLAKEAPLTKKQAKAAAAKKKKADDKEKAKLAKENSKALAKAKAKFQKERAKAEKLAEKLAAKGEKKGKAAPKKKATKVRKSKSKETHDEGTAKTPEIDDGDAEGTKVTEPKKPRAKKAKLHNTPGDGPSAVPEASCPAPAEAPDDRDASTNPPQKRKAEDLPEGTHDPKESPKEKATFARRIRGKTEKAAKRWDSIKGVFMELVAPMIRRPSPFEAYVCQQG